MPHPLSRLLLPAALAAFAASAQAAPPPLDTLTVAPGWSIETWVADIPRARSMARSPSGVVYVGTREGGTVYAVRPTSDGGREVLTILRGLDSPNGVAFRNGALYVAEISRINRYDAIESDLARLPKPVTIAKLPTEKHHGWRYMAFGPDDKLYVAIGAPCNVCDRDAEDFATIVRMNPDGSGREVVARGVRNSVGFTWQPKTRAFWFTDNGRDMLGDDVPPCELNKLTKTGEHFGFPFCHGGDIVDPEYGKLGRCSDVTAPVQRLGPHVAPLGLAFVDGDVVIAEHGSWNRSERIGYRLMRVKLEGDRAVAYEPFVTGWLRPDGSVTGRPVDILTLPDGSLLVSDDKAGAIYRLNRKIS